MDAAAVQSGDPDVKGVVAGVRPGGPAAFAGRNDQGISDGGVLPEAYPVQLYLTGAGPQVFIPVPEGAAVVGYTGEFFTGVSG